MTEPEIVICDDKTISLPRQPDNDGFYIHCLGGFRAAMAKKDTWIVEPLLDGGHPCRKGFFTKAELDAFLNKTGLNVIAFHDFGWSKGIYHSRWSPLIPRRKNHMQGPSDLWRNIAKNLKKQRHGKNTEALTAPTREKIAALSDDHTEEERLARSISFSLRSMDISVEQIAEFYHEQLTNFLASGFTNGQRWSGTSDQTLFAHVHSFFLHLGAARDYLAALIADRVGKKFDSMARLIDALPSKHIESDALLRVLASLKYVQPKSTNPGRLEVAGWLKDASNLRNQFVHRRPYGSRHFELFGYLTAIAPECGLYRYQRPILMEGDVQGDILDVIVYHYQRSTELFQDVAEASGRDTSMLTLTDKDILWTDGPPQFKTSERTPR